MTPTRGKRLLVTGAGGVMGGYAAHAYDDAEIYLASRQDMDVRDAQRVMQVVEKIRPLLVLHLAAETDVDRCEREPEHAHRSNVEGTLNVVLACQRHNIDLVYVSTLGVFDGLDKLAHTEDDVPSPVNVYGRTKLEAESVVRERLSRFYIVRTGWMFGGKEKDKKFVGKIATLCIGRNGNEIKVVNDKFGNPTYARDLLEKIRQLTDSGSYGLFHIANEGTCSRYEVAVEIARLLRSDTQIVPIASDAFPLTAPRPRSEAGRNKKLETIGLAPMRNWKLALKDYLESWEGHASPAVFPQGAGAGDHAHKPGIES